AQHSVLGTQSSIARPTGEFSSLSDDAFLPSSLLAMLNAVFDVEPEAVGPGFGAGFGFDGVKPSPGIFSVCPAMMRLGLEMWFALASAPTVVWNRLASADNVSPRLIV